MDPSPMWKKEVHMSTGELDLNKEKGTCFFPAYSDRIYYPFYRERRQKEGIRPGRRSGTLEYRERTFFYFQPNMSVGSDEDIMTVLNIPFVVSTDV